MKYCLFIDELGESTPSRNQVSPLYIITGSLVDKDKIEKISNNLDHIKFKYWNTTEIVFHSKEIGKKEKKFSIFKSNISLFREFTKDLENFLTSCPINIISVLVDQKESFLVNWNQKTVIKKAYYNIFSNFIRILVAKNITGEIIQEASTPLQDITIYEKFYEFQAKGLITDNISHKEIKERLTSLSFVTKHNMDTITQISDLLAYGLNLEDKIKTKTLNVNKLNGYQKMIRKQAINKLYKIGDNIGIKKKSKYKTFDAALRLP
jgi:hypothetical protein